MSGTSDLAASATPVGNLVTLIAVSQHGVHSSRVFEIILI
jgi:hypothetical protein